MIKMVNWGHRLPKCGWRDSLEKWRNDGMAVKLNKNYLADFIGEGYRELEDHPFEN